MGQIEQQEKIEKDLKEKRLTFIPGAQTKGMIGYIRRGEDETLIEIYDHGFYVQDWHYCVTPEIVELINLIHESYPIEELKRFY